MYIPAAVG